MARELNERQLSFIRSYLNCWNGVRAAREAGYTGSYSTLCVIASDNLRNVKIKAAIDKRLKAKQLSIDETLARMCEHAKADISEFIRHTKENGDSCPAWVDIKAMVEAGKGYLITGLDYNKDGLPVAKIVDKQKALEQVGKAYGIFKEVTEVAGEVVVKTIRGVSMDDL